MNLKSEGGKTGTIAMLFPDPDDLLALQPEELAGVILECLDTTYGTGLNRCNLLRPPSTLADYQQGDQEKISRAMTEAWIWLEREGFLAPLPEAENRDWVFVTKRGARISTRTHLDAYLKASLLPGKLLHPLIAQKVYPAFLRGEYDTAVFQAFREVEVAVRDAGGFQPADIGVPLMREAFKDGSGPLTDAGLPAPEQQAAGHLFAGAIGYCKNPLSHRNVPMGAEETVELLMFASHLLRIVDARVLSKGSAAT